MAHAIETMLSVKETPWHGLGKVVQSAPTFADALQLSGLDWRVNLVDITAGGQTLAEFGKAVQRSSDGKILGVVGPKWRPLQNAQAFAWFEPFAAAGALQVETAGALHGGKVVWVMARTPDTTEVAPGDYVRQYVLLSNSHDGSSSVRVGFTPIRVVCANTLGQAHGNQASKLLRVRHTKSLMPTLREVRDIMSVATAEFAATTEQYRTLARRKINKADLRRYVTLVVAADPANTTGAEDRKVEDIINRATAGIGNDGALTLWQAYNGVTEYMSWAAGRTVDTRLDSLWFGQGEGKLRESLELAIGMAS